MWNRGAKKVGAGALAVMNNLKVPAGVLLAWLLFGESLDVARVAIGLAMIGGALLVTRSRP